VIQYLRIIKFIFRRAESEHFHVVLLQNRKDTYADEAVRICPGCAGCPATRPVAGFSRPPNKTKRVMWPAMQLCESRVKTFVLAKPEYIVCVISQLEIQLWSYEYMKILLNLDLNSHFTEPCLPRPMLLN
jgi:hypothetical protein